MTEVGPYVFSEGHQKVNITWNGENDTVSFQQVRFEVLLRKIDHKKD